MAFKICSKKEQGKLRRPTASLLGEYQPSSEELREGMIENLASNSEIITALEMRRDRLKIKFEKMKETVGRRDPVRKALGCEIHSLEERIQILKKRKPEPRLFHEFLFEVIRHSVSEEQWESWIKRATELERKIVG